MRSVRDTDKSADLLPWENFQSRTVVSIFQKPLGRKKDTSLQILHFYGLKLLYWSLSEATTAINYPQISQIGKF